MDRKIAKLMTLSYLRVRVLEMLQNGDSFEDMLPYVKLAASKEKAAKGTKKPRVLLPNEQKG